MPQPHLPPAASSIQKGVPLKEVLNKAKIEQLSFNIKLFYDDFNSREFVASCLEGLEPLSLTQRAQHIAEQLHANLPPKYEDAVNILLASLTPPLERTSDNGLAPMFYMPHANFISTYGVDPKHNDGHDPFDTSMRANYELTSRFTSEFCIRPFIEVHPKRTFNILYSWMNDPNPHVRRLCSEGTRPRLPWAIRLKQLAADPSPSLPILEHLKNDDDLYVRRSVANHLGDIAKDHLDLVLDTCERWLEEASIELKWVVRHALRHPAKKEVQRALEIRKAAK